MSPVELALKWNRKPLWWLKSLIHTLTRNPEDNDPEDCIALEAARLCLAVRRNEKRYAESGYPAGTFLEYWPPEVLL